MKYFVIIGLLFLSSCCWNDKDGSCNCDPPSPKLSEEALKWISPYEGREYFIFKNEEGNFDSLKVERISEKEFVGGDECGTNYEIEITKLASISNSVKFEFRAKYGNEVSFNESYPSDNFIHVGFRLSNPTPYTAQQDISLNLINGILSADCKNGFDCSNYNMTNLKISKQEGLIEYTTADNLKPYTFISDLFLDFYKLLNFLIFSFLTLFFSNRALLFI